ncbi:hydratase [Pseudomonas sp. Leaf58]|uniref:2-keto-4-pentenoate hydratase n=1 Tax=Pseudomonas sp. Leaf58 TaxID=1736226 RepID=UPI0006FDD46D|nr:fumarylacetoacetate hydrolase family protein [Pseudomonas sp. Leaf58]AYG45475.1 hydratase [Pseudomonas sp. Leaf58]KQN61598.1 hydratase [Pseudomonas sp. Leaf58]
MHTSLFTHQRTAAFLLQHWRSGELLTELPASLKPETLKQGYDSQDQLFAAAAGQRAGWKLGVGSPAGMRAAQLSRPLIGQLEAARCHPGGVHIQLPAVTPVTIECEVAFVLDRDIPPQAGRVPVSEDIRATCVSFEVVRSRFIDRKSVGWPSFVADNVGFEALVVGNSLGAGISVPLLADLAATCEVYVDGEFRARGLSGDAATDPLVSLAHLYAHAAERGQALKAGDIVTTGAMCQPFDLNESGHRITARYFGQELSFSL